MSGLSSGPRLAALALFGIAATGPAAAGFQSLSGDWVSDTMVMDDPPACAPETIAVSIGGKAGQPTVSVKAGSAVDLDMTLTMGDDGKVFVERGGWMKRFGMSEETTRDALIENKPVIWARETETGAVIYRSRISETGSLNLLRLALEPVDGGIAATLELTDGDCHLGPVTTALKSG